MNNKREHENNLLDNSENTYINKDSDLEGQLSFDDISYNNPTNNPYEKYDESINLENCNCSQNDGSLKKIYTKTISLALISSIVGTIGANTIINKYMNNNTSNTTINISSTDDLNVYQAVAQKASPSVVGITTKSIDTNNLFSLPQESSGTGTGIVIDSRGYILTNSHVVKDGEALEILVLDNNGNTTQGKVLWSDELMDLAVVKIDGNNLIEAELGDSDSVKVGDLAIAIGNPLGLDFQKSVTQGIVSGVDRSINSTSLSMSGLIQTDASINPGNSGGPLLNNKGQVIGINTAKVSDSEGIGFAIPINVAKSIISQVIKTGTFEKVTLGIKGTTVKTFEAIMNIDIQSENGIYIVEVEKDSAASRAGISSGDIITKINDIELRTMNDLNSELYKYNFGEKVTITIEKDGKKIEKIVEFKK